MNPSYSTQSVALTASSVSHSTSLSSLASTHSSLSASTASSYYRSGSESGILSLSSSLTSVEDLQECDADAFPAHPRFGSYDGYDLPFVRARPSPRKSLRIQLGDCFVLLRRRAQRSYHRLRLQDVVVTALFCYYLWVLLHALAGRVDVASARVADEASCLILSRGGPLGNGTATRDGGLDSMRAVS